MKSIIIMIFLFSCSYATQYEWEKHEDIKLYMHENCCGENYENCKGDCLKSEHSEHCKPVWKKSRKIYEENENCTKWETWYAENLPKNEYLSIITEFYSCWCAIDEALWG